MAEEAIYVRSIQFPHHPRSLRKAFVQELTVSLQSASYPILIGEGLLEDMTRCGSAIGGAAVLVTHPSVEEPVARPLAQALGSSCHGCYVFPDGEEHKTLEDLNGLYTWLLEQEFGRDITLVAVGGGVVGDMTGFAAATYMRGVDFVQVPTTLLAQVDASVGGKTGVNHPLGKNMIGAFWQPKAVLIDPATLGTLPERELRSGIAEVIKAGLLGDAAFFEWLETHMEKVLALEADALLHVIHTSCACKARIVADDERERGARALLNLGHTFAHAIETEQGYTQWRHGEAVGCGMVLAADLSVRMGWLEAQAAERVQALVARAGLPTRLPEDLGAAQLRAHMRHDKKNLGGRQRFVLLREIGQAEITDQVDERLLDATLAGVR